MPISFCLYFSARAIWGRYYHRTGVHHLPQWRQILGHCSTYHQGKDLTCIDCCIVCPDCSFLLVSPFKGEYWQICLLMICHSTLENLFNFVLSQ